MKEFITKYRVYYEDTDAGGVVYYGNFLKFAERARTDFLRNSGRSHIDYMNSSGEFFVVRRVEIDYLSPGRLDDMIEVKTSIIKIGRTSIDMQQTFFNQNGLKLADANIQIVCVLNADGKIKSTKIPDELVKHFS